MNRCEVEHGSLRPCRPLQDLIESERLTILLLGRPEGRWWMVAKCKVQPISGNMRQRGVLIRYCPFCGAYIRDQEEG